MKYISWNVNGLRACIEKGFLNFIKENDFDIVAIQETKMKEEQLRISDNDAMIINKYFRYFNSAVKAGYSGTLVLSKEEPQKVFYDFEKINLDEHNTEGRIITLEFDTYFFVNVYVPNSQRLLARLDYRRKFNEDFKNYLDELKKEKSVIVCGDFNVAHQPIDLKNPKENVNNAGFSLYERLDFTNLLDIGYIDTFRYKNSQEVCYTWWSYQFQARNKNIGWRIDYFLVSEDLADKIENADIYDEILGSDHCPIGLEISIK